MERTSESWCQLEEQQRSSSSSSGGGGSGVFSPPRPTSSPPSLGRRLRRRSCSFAAFSQPLARSASVSAPLTIIPPLPWTHPSFSLLPPFGLLPPTFPPFLSRLSSLQLLKLRREGGRRGATKGKRGASWASVLCSFAKISFQKVSVGGRRSA